MGVINNKEDVLFQVGGTECSQLPYIAVIPAQYKELFDGVRFKDRQHLADAVLYAECAETARANGNQALQEKNETILRILLGKDEPSLEDKIAEAAERSAEAGNNQYYKEKDGWFEYYVNATTGEKKMSLDEGDVCVERNVDDFLRDEVKE